MFRLLLARRRLAVLICAATLVLKLLVPGGYMVDSVSGHLAITICSGTALRTTTMDMPGMHGAMADHGMGKGQGGGKDHGGAKDHGRAEMPCAFSGLSAATLAPVDPVLLAALIAFILGVGFAGLPLPPAAAISHLRPPLRGPPASL